MSPPAFISDLLKYCCVRKVVCKTNLREGLSCFRYIWTFLVLKGLMISMYATSLKKETLLGAHKMFLARSRV